MIKKFYKSYFFKIIFFSILFLVLVAITNYTVDPEKIYTSKNNINDEFNLHNTLNKLMSKKDFLFFKNKNWNDRDLYNLFSKKYKNIDCIVFGASSVVSISVVQKPIVLGKYCKSILNLGMPGATFEDYFALSNNFLLDNFQNKKIFLSIHPFTLNFNKDNRWIKNSKSFYEFLNKIKFQTPNNERKKARTQFFSKSISNLLSYEYFETSLKVLLNLNENTSFITNKIDEIDLKTTNVILFDGSKKKRNLDKNNKIEIDLNKVNYKISSNKFIDKDVLELLLKYKIYFHKNNDVIFLLTPFHPDVLKLKNEPIYQALEIVETTLHQFSKKNQIDIVGSFSAENVKCFKYEFFDATHPSNSCLKKLGNLYYNYNN